MDKRGAKILISCIFCTAIILILFMLAYRFTLPSCELISIDPMKLKNSAMAAWKPKSTKSHDKTLSIQIAAYLEYNIAKPPPTDPSSNHNKSQELPLATPSNTQQQLAIVNAINNLTASSMAPPPPPQQQLPHPTPNVPYSNLSQPSTANNQQPLQQQPIPLLNHTVGNQANANLTISTNLIKQQYSGKLDPSELNSRRFLPMELADVEFAKSDDNKFKYVLKFNCSTITFKFVKKSEYIFVNKISLDLKATDNQLNPKHRETKCVLRPNTNQGSFFGTEISNATNWAHYYCDKYQSFSCYHDDQLVAVLHVHRLEWELGRSQSLIHKTADFLSEVKSK